MASAKATATFFTHGTHTQYEQVLKLYPQALKLKADRRPKKPEELVKLDNWYQNELPKKIKSRGKDAHMVHEELVQTMKWKQTRGKFYPQLSYLVKVNTPRAVMAETKKAFKKLPNLEQAITALSNLKGVGTTMASALLAAACPEKAPFMADECLLAIPDIEGIDYTTKEYLKFTNHIQAVSDRLNKEAVKDKILKNNCAVADGDEKKSDVGATDTDDGVVAEENAVFVWSPHKVEMALWTYYIVSDMKPELLSSVSIENGNSLSSLLIHHHHHHSNHHQNGDSLDTTTSEDGSNPMTGAPPHHLNGKSTTSLLTTGASSVLDEDTNTSFADARNNSSSSPSAVSLEEEVTNDSIVSDSTNDSSNNVVGNAAIANNKRQLDTINNDDDDSNSIVETSKKLRAADADDK